MMDSIYMKYLVNMEFFFMMNSVKMKCPLNMGVFMMDGIYMKCLINMEFL